MGSHGLLNSVDHGNQTLRREGDVDDLDDELHLRHLHCEQLDWGKCCCTQQTRQPRPRAAPVETPPKTSQKTVLLVHTGHDVEHQGPEDNEGIQREVRRDQEDQPRRLTHKLVSTVEPSKH